jgi:aspartyl-tRNA(Asn)/glutamyl-tRNA(Gln) amidotransferase subunit A
MAGDEPAPLEPVPLAGLRLGIPQGMPLADLDATVMARFAAAREALGRAGVRVSEEKIDDFLDAMGRINAKSGFAPAEAYSIHRERLAAHGDDYDPNVRYRIERGAALSAADYVAMARERAALVRGLDSRLSDLDAFVLPTTPIVAPRMDEVATRETFAAKNMLLLRNTSIVNFFDQCAISLPLPRDGGLPVGLMLVARNGHDHRLFRIAAAVERLFAR